jgi:glucosamine 6-phosphate synthetase-like amidotransferase/phosphosugar isomerase protein
MADLLQKGSGGVPSQYEGRAINVFLGCDVDQPRNLAKSVTVE